jgi:hypothetical protein
LAYFKLLLQFFGIYYQGDIVIIGLSGYFCLYQNTFFCMSWLDRLFGKKEETSTAAIAASNGLAKNPQPVKGPFAGLEGIRFGRYSDNNKTQQKMQSWYNAEDLFKAKKYNEAIFSVFDNIRDEAEDNVHFSQDDNTFIFDIQQGSKKVHGKSDGENIVAYATLDVMETRHRRDAAPARPELQPVLLPHGNEQ